MRFTKALLLISSCVLSCVLFLAHFGVANAGIEPSPWQPEINQLGAVENVLVSANDRIVKVMAKPPDDITPSPDLNGALNRLDAINKQLVSVDDMVASMIAEVMGIEPSPFADLPDLVPALTGVNGAAQIIVDEIQAKLGVEPTPFVPELPSKLRDVRDSAQIISTHTQEYINQIAAPCPDTVACGAFGSQEDCESVLCCKWFPATDVAGSEPYCDIDPDYPLSM